jgi:hypothetical protein
MTPLTAQQRQQAVRLARAAARNPCAGYGPQLAKIVRFTQDGITHYHHPDGRPRFHFGDVQYAWAGQPLDTPN